MNAYHADTGSLPRPNHDRGFCPYPHQNGGGNPTPLVAAPEDKLAVTHCTDPGCLQPVFFCSACGAGNRTLAQYCRKCRHALSFETTQTQRLANVEITQRGLTKGARQVLFSRLHGHPITALESAWGYLVFAAQGWGLGVMANTCLNPPRLLYHLALEPGEEITVLHSHPSACVLAVSRRAIYALTLAPHIQSQQLYCVPDNGWQIESTLSLHARVVVRLYHPKTKFYRWIVLQDLDGTVTDLPLRARGLVSAMVSMPGAEKFCYGTEAEVVQFALSDNQEQRFAAPDYGLNVKVPPQAHPRTGEIFWHGLEGLVYRFNADSEKTPFRVFHEQRLEVVHFFSNAYDDYLYALTADNLVIFDYPRGEQLWGLAQELKARIQCSAARPRPFGNYLLFAFRSPSLSGAQERVGLLSLTKREAPLLLHPAAATAPMPIGGFSNLIAVRNAQTPEEREKTALMLFQI